MASPRELPQLIGEFVEMAKEYLRQETLDPAKRLGRFAGFSIAAGVVAAIGAIPLVIAGNRLLIEVLPSDPGHRMWSGLGYVLSAIGVVVIAAIMARLATR